MKRLGIIGGLGPMATAYFFQLLIEMTAAEKDQEHIEILIHNKPQIPDRTRYILGRSEQNPLPELIGVGKGLVMQGAEVIAMPCVTAHFFQQMLEEEIQIPVLNAITETAQYLKLENIHTVGIMATDGTVESKLFQSILEENGIGCVLPEKGEQEDVMHLIYQNVKAGKAMEMERFERVSKQLFDKGAEVILLGCTELSMAKKDHGIGKGFLDVLEVLARKAVLTCGTLKEEYQHLIIE